MINYIFKFFRICKNHFSNNCHCYCWMWMPCVSGTWEIPQNLLNFLSLTWLHHKFYFTITNSFSGPPSLYFGLNKLQPGSKCIMVEARKII